MQVQSVTLSRDDPKYLDMTKCVIRLPPVFKVYYNAQVIFIGSIALALLHHSFVLSHMRLLVFTNFNLETGYFDIDEQ